MRPLGPPRIALTITGSRNAMHIALALQLGLLGIDAAGDVDAERQREVDVLLVLRPVLGRRRQGQQDEG